MSSADAQQLGDGYIGLVRWDRLFEDLESRVAAQSRLELDAEVAERTRLERARITLGERVAGAMGARVTAQLRGGSVLRARVEDSGDGWVLLVEDGGRQVLVPVSSVLGISGLGRPRDDTRARRFGLGSAVRGSAVTAEQCSCGMWTGAACTERSMRSGPMPSTSPSTRWTHHAGRRMSAGCEPSPSPQSR